MVKSWARAQRRTFSPSWWLRGDRRRRRPCHDHYCGTPSLLFSATCGFWATVNFNHSPSVSLDSVFAVWLLGHSNWLEVVQSALCHHLQVFVGWWLEALARLVGGLPVSHSVLVQREIVTKGQNDPLLSHNC